jgi:hypothetical protein
MPRPFSPAQQRQNRAFLAILARTGNARLAAREVGIHRATLTKRRASHPAFAAEWDAALALAHATLSHPPRNGEGDRRATPGGGGAAPNASRQSPQPRLIRQKSGRLQLRAPAKGQLTRAVEQAFLAALSATANVRLSAKAAGFTHSAFYQHKRANPGFAREWRLALQMGYDRLEMALIESTAATSTDDAAWRHNDPPPIPAMTANQALQLMYLHQKEARLIEEQQHIKRRPGEPKEAHRFRLAAMYEERQRRDREAFDLAETARRARGEERVTGPEELPELPALDQVTGWSKADPATRVADATRALFGGWRLGDLGYES